ncbi:MAG TPA: ATP-dependent endonuclease [Luteibacter sp.]|uniref:ATP-dependent nuclease n=1 Tax=Luteibacter sp. TaxID=1886636 RepID=UPI002CF34018|nr:ATP-dependent endonuclease [Luteibacter sp.]HVI57111.1 ATP-dependent endonuclease [Luteibacter sp.]
MQIDKIEIENFRSIREAEVRFDDITAFVGRNGAGKSTVLYALEAFYNVGAQYSELDYYNHVTLDTSIRIRVTYGKLRQDEIDEFGRYVQGGKLTVSKIINAGGARYYGTAMQVPEFAHLRTLGAADKRRGLVDRVDAGDFPDFPAVPRASADIDRVMDEYEVAHPDLTRPVDRETQFFGPRNVGGGKLDKFTKFVLVPAVRDANAETEKRGAIMQLLELIVTRSIASRQDFQNFKRQFEDEARRLYGKDNLPELTDLGKLVTEKLARYAPGAELVIDFGELKPPVIPLPDALITVSEDNFKAPVRYSGHGLQRALILALLEQLSMTQTPSDPADGQGNEGENVGELAPRLPNLILAIEEPELYLHPARSRYLATILRGLAAKIEGQVRPETQVVYVTHSPYFVDVEHFDEVRLCRKVPGEADAPGTTGFRPFSREQAATRLAEISGRRPEEFSAKSFVTHAAPVLTSIVNEGLFADVAVVVEGESDIAALWSMQMLMNQRWDEKGIVLVPAGGKNNLDRVVVVFQGFGIPTYFIFDGDRAKNEGASANRLLLRLGGEEVVDYPDTKVGQSCANFDEDIEAYLKNQAGDRFLPLRDECANECGHPKPGKALKNSEVMAMFLSRAHDEGIGFPVLRQIVERVTALA